MDTTKLEWDLRQIWKHIEELRKKVDSLETNKAMPLAPPKFWMRYQDPNDNDPLPVMYPECIYGFTLPIYCFTREMLVGMVRELYVKYAGPSNLESSWAVHIDHYLKSNGGV